jgi:hypothetical protein
MVGDYKIPTEMKPTIDRVYDDISAVLTDYENNDIGPDDLYDFMVALHREISLVVYND